MRSQRVRPYLFFVRKTFEIISTLSALVILVACNNHSKNTLPKEYPKTVCKDLFEKVLHDPHILENFDFYTLTHDSLDYFMHYYFRRIPFVTDTAWDKTTKISPAFHCESKLEDDSTAYYVRAEDRVITNPRKFTSCDVADTSLKNALKAEVQKFDNLSLVQKTGKTDKLKITFLQPIRTRHTIYQYLLVNDSLLTDPIQIGLYLDASSLRMRYYEVLLSD